MSKKGWRVGLAGLMAASSIAAAPAALAATGDVVARGDCRAGSEWKLQLRPIDGMIRVALEVDEDVVGSEWQFVLKANGRRIMKGTRTTQEPSGSFKAMRRIPDGEGTETITASAANLASGETCSGSATI